MPNSLPSAWPMKGVILSREEKWHESAESMKQLWNYHDDLRDSEMSKLSKTQ